MTYVWENLVWLLIGVVVTIIGDIILRRFILGPIRRPKLLIDNLYEHPHGQGQWYITVRNLPRTRWPFRYRWLQRIEATSCEVSILISGDHVDGNLINMGRWAGNVSYINIGPDLPERKRRHPTDRAQDVHIMNIHPSAVGDFHFGGVPHTGHFPRTGRYKLLLTAKSKEATSQSRKVVIDFSGGTPYIPRFANEC